MRVQKRLHYESILSELGAINGKRPFLRSPAFVLRRGGEWNQQLIIHCPTGGCRRQSDHPTLSGENALLLENTRDLSLSRKKPIFVAIFRDGETGLVLCRGPLKPAGNVISSDGMDHDFELRFLQYGGTFKRPVFGLLS